MDPKDTPPKAQPPQAEPEEPPRKRRRRGYRGYPNTPSGGDVHAGSGFGGAGSLNTGGGAGMPESGFVSERTREDAKKEKKD